MLKAGKINEHGGKKQLKPSQARTTNHERAIELPNKPSIYKALVQQYGLGRCLFRFFHDLKRRYGLTKRKFPTWNWHERPLSYWLRPGMNVELDQYRAFHQNTNARFFFALGAPPKPHDDWTRAALSQAESILQGKFRYFSRKDGQIGYPEPDWFRNPFTGQVSSANYHWCDCGDFVPSQGDIKFIWEPSRFCWAYSLVRAYAATQDDKYPEAFWRLVESWVRANPPQMGPNWQCGQEIAIRLMACVFSLYAFWKSPVTSDDRIASLMVLIAASAERILGNINYARVQMGNHAVTEATAIWTTGMLFPELKSAEHWKKVGKYVLEDEVRSFNLPDGAYIQHSINYHRLMLHSYLWCLRLAELNGEQFSSLMLERLKRSYQFLYQLQDPDTGTTPNYGRNDGANILPLNDCDYTDYRPITGAVHFFYNRTRLYKQGPWSEDLLWLFGRDALDRPLGTLNRTGKNFLHGGYFTLTGKETWAFIRCHSFRSRPAHADILHLDLWWHGINILRDSGSFKYYDPEENWDYFFVSTPAHNTVALAGLDQMIKGPRFMWYTLARSRFVEHKELGELELWQGEHYGYARLASKAVCRRLVCKIADAYWLTIDDVIGRGKETASLNWNFVDTDFSLKENHLQLITPQGPVSIVLYCSLKPNKIIVARGQDGHQRLGWQSLYYGEKTPAPTLCIDATGELPIRFISFISLGQDRPVQSDGLSFVRWSSESTGSIEIKLSKPIFNQKILATLTHHTDAAEES